MPAGSRGNELVIIFCSISGKRPQGCESNCRGCHRRSTCVRGWDQVKVVYVANRLAKAEVRQHSSYTRVPTRFTQPPHPDGMKCPIEANPTRTGLGEANPHLRFKSEEWAT